MKQESQNSMTNIKTRQQIAQEYGVTPKTLKSWLEKLAVQLPCCSLTPLLQKRIYEALGYPDSVKKTDYDPV